MPSLYDRVKDHPSRLTAPVQAISSLISPWDYDMYCPSCGLCTCPYFLDTGESCPSMQSTLIGSMSQNARQ